MTSSFRRYDTGTTTYIIRIPSGTPKGATASGLLYLPVLRPLLRRRLRQCPFPIPSSPTPHRVWVHAMATFRAKANNKPEVTFFCTVVSA